MKRIGIFTLFLAVSFALWLPSAQAVVFSIQVGPGSSGDQVLELQNFLKQFPDIYPEGLVTGFYGSLTTAAVQRFQVKYDIVSSGSPETSGYGRVGPATIAKLNQIASVGAPAEPAPAPAAAFTIQMSLGLRHAQVEELQKFLAQDEEVYPEGLITGLYGPLTQAAIQRFQAKYGIVSSGLPETTGYGRVGPATLSKLNELRSAVLVPLPSPEAAPAAPAPEPTPTTTPDQPVAEAPACRERKVPAEYATIKEAIAAACEGDTILVAAGTYKENLIIKTNKLTLKGAGAEQTFITPDIGQVITTVDGVDTLTIDGFTISSGFGDAAILLSAPTKVVSWTIQNNIIKNSSIGISLRAAGGDVVIKRNLILANKNIGIVDDVTTPGKVLAENNTIAKGTSGYHLAASTGSHTLKNNIIFDFSLNGVELSSLSSDQEHKILFISYNDVWSSRSGINGYYSNRRNAAFTPEGVGNLSTDPMFAAPDSYILRTGSLVINAGDPASPKDPDGTRADMGAYPTTQSSSGGGGGGGY